MDIVTRLEFEAAHMLPHYHGKCRNVHGHNYVVEIGLRGEVQPDDGMVVDFGVVKALAKQWLDQMDHAFVYGPDTPIELLHALHDNSLKVFELPGPPTAENMADFLFGKLQADVALLHFVRVWETPKSYAEARGK